MRDYRGQIPFDHTKVRQPRRLVRADEHPQPVIDLDDTDGIRKHVQPGFILRPVLASAPSDDRHHQPQPQQPARPDSRSQFGIPVPSGDTVSQRRTDAPRTLAIGDPPLLPERSVRHGGSGLTARRHGDAIPGLRYREQLQAVRRQLDASTPMVSGRRTATARQPEADRAARSSGPAADTSPARSRAAPQLVSHLPRPEHAQDLAQQLFARQPRGEAAIATMALPIS